MLSIKIFEATQTRAVGELIVPIQSEEFGIAVTLEDQPDLKNIPGFYQCKAGNFWVAVFNGVVVGTIALLDIGNRQAALRKMFVAKGYRGKEFGVSAALLMTLLKWANQQELREIYLGTTDKFLAAHRFYEKNGFKEISTTQLPASFPIMSIDSKFYKHDLLKSTHVEKLALV